MIHYQETPDPSGGLMNSAGFEDSNVRRFFVRKVYSVLTLQLLFTSGVIALFNGSDAVQEALGPYENPGRAQAILYTSYAFFIFTYFCLVCPCCNFAVSFRSVFESDSFLAKIPPQHNLSMPHDCCNVLHDRWVALTSGFCKPSSLGVITCFYSTKAVLLAGATTTAVVAFVTGFTFYSKFDITKVIAREF